MEKIMKTKILQTSLFAVLIGFLAGASSASAQQMPQIPGTPPTAETTNEHQPQANQVAQPPKKEGIKRIGVVSPKAQMGHGTSLQDASEPIKQTIISYLSGPGFEIVALSGKIPAQNTAEAKEKQCDYILFTSVTHKKGGSGFGGFMKLAAPVAGMIPNLSAMGGASGGAMTGMVTQTVLQAATEATTQQNAAQEIANISGSSIKAKDEITMEYKLFSSSDNAQLIANTLKLKAKQNGEDVITRLVEQLATTIVELATHK
jgi:hypothetical protein